MLGLYFKFHIPAEEGGVDGAGDAQNNMRACLISDRGPPVPIDCGWA